MITKKVTRVCKGCGKPLLPNEELFKENPYLKSNFRLKKYCNEECRVKYNNKLKRDKYVLSETDHNNNVYAVNKLIEGDINFRHKINAYNPDIIKEDTEFEVELFRKTVHLRNKASKWDDLKKHTLIVCISQQSMDLFDNVMFFHKGELIKVK